MFHGGGRPFQGRPGLYHDPRKIDRILTVNRRSSYLPDTLAAKLQEAENDPELMSLRGDLSLIEVRLSQLLDMVGNDDSKKKWDTLKKMVDNCMFHIDQNDTIKATVALRMCLEFIDRVGKEFSAWDEIFEILELRRKIGESEGNRLVRMNQMISAEDAMKLFDRMIEILQRHIKDPNTYAAIAYELAIATGTAPTRVHAEGSGEVQPRGSGDMDQTALLDSGTERSDSAGAVSGNVPAANSAT